MAKTDQREGRGGGVHRRQEKRFWRQNPEELGDPPKMEAPTEESLTWRRGRAGEPGIRVGRVQFHCSWLLRAWSQGTRASAVGMGRRRQTEGLHLPATTSRRRPS